MNVANPETTNLLLGILTVIAIAQFLLLIGVIVIAKMAIDRLRLATSLLVGGDVRHLHGRLSRLLADIEVLVARGNTVLGAVEQGAQDLGAAASAVGQTTQQVLALGSLEARAVGSAVRAGLGWFMHLKPWRRNRLRALAAAKG
jgi:hypothetical protein